MMNEEFFVVLNVIAAITIVVCNVLSIHLLVGISKELKGLKNINKMWQFFIVMSSLFLLLGIVKATGTIESVIFASFQPFFDAMISVILILFSVFATLLSISIEELSE